MANKEARRKVGLPKRLLKRLYASCCNKHLLFRISRKEVRELALRDLFRKRNRRAVVQAGLRIHMVRNSVAQLGDQVDWLHVYDHLVPQASRPSPADNSAVIVDELDYLLTERKPAPSGSQYEDEVRFANCFDEEETKWLHLLLLDESLHTLATSTSKSAREDVLRWVFRPRFAQHPRNKTQTISTDLLPFNFRLCCSMGGFGWEQVQDGLLRLLTPEERNQYATYAEVGDRTFRHSWSGKRHASRRRRQPSEHARETSGLCVSA
ncbi:MAG: hypothetical protein LW865_13105 [Betaproteobacteria bacterium]|nr:hypothetical protein [Betaproteobacteria bacterium]